MLHDTRVLQQELNPQGKVYEVGLQEQVMSKLPFAKRHTCNRYVTINYIHETNMHVVIKRYVSSSIFLRSFTCLPSYVPYHSHHQLNLCLTDPKPPE